MISKIIFLCILFSACTTRKSETTPVERQKIQAFLNQFLFVEGAVYALFGDKPISQMLVFIGDDADRAQLSAEQLKTAIFVDDSTVVNWRAWRHFIRKLPSKHFILAERPCVRDAQHVIYSLLNVRQVKDVLAEHKLAFEQKTGGHFNIDQVIQQFKDPQSSFWSKAFADHYLSGLLFGYGEENIVHFIDIRCKVLFKAFQTIYHAISPSFLRDTTQFFRHYLIPSWNTKKSNLQSHLLQKVLGHSAKFPLQQ